jgi:hypothetical protein
MANVVVSAIATFNGKALKKGQKELSAFDKQAQQLGKTFNRVFATTALVAFSKKAITAFAADEAAAKSLAVQLENTGNAFRVDEVEAYIASTQKLYKVLDDQLRPAFQTLLNATGSVTLSQNALNTALNVSAGTGASLETVINAIAAGVRGQTKAIKGLNTGIDANIIATGDMNKIMAALEKRFTGAALARLDTYAGKMDALKIAAADATEIIGAGLLDALTALGKDNSIDQAANSMNGFAIAIANTAKGMGELIGEVQKIIDSDVGKFLLGLTALLTLGKKQIIVGAAGLIAYDIGKTQKADPSSAAARVKDYNITTKLFKAKKDEYNIITASNKQRTEVDKLKDKFDLERIGLAAALNYNISAEDKLRVQALTAIANNDEALAKKYLAELAAAEAAKKLADATLNLEAAFKATIARLAIYDPVKAYGATNSSEIATALAALEASKKQLAELQQGGVDTTNSIINGKVNPNAFMPPATTPYDPLSSLMATMADISSAGAYNPLSGLRATPQEIMDIRVTVDAGGDRLSQAIAESIQVATRSGYSTTPAGFL